MARPIPPAPEVSARIRALVNETSIASVARQLDLAEATVARLAGGLNVTRGTNLLAAERLLGLDKGAA